MPLIPHRLQIGDTIGVVTPSGPISSSLSPDPYRELEKGISESVNTTARLRAKLDQLRADGVV